MILHKQIGLSILCVAFLNQNSYYLTHISLASYLWDMGKQFKTSSGSPLFAYRNFF